MQTLKLEEFEDTEGVIIIRKSKDRQHNGQKKENKRTINDIQNIAHKTKDPTQLQPWMNSGASEG